MVKNRSETVDNKERVLSMATIVENKKDGKVVSYKFRAYLGKDDFGKPINKYTTWKAPKELTPTKAMRAAKKAAEEWEQEVRDEYEKDLQDLQRAKNREIEKERTEFGAFAEELWFPLKIDNGEHKHTTVDFYKNTMPRVVEYFRGRAVQSITAIDIQKYLRYLRTEYRTKQGKPIGDKSIKHCYCILVLIFAFAMEQEIILKNPMDKSNLSETEQEKD